MSIVLILGFATLVFYLISQFGGSLTARNSLVWWLIFVFLGFCVIWPNGLRPVAQLLGVQIVSNLVFAVMILFLAFQAIQESAFTTRQSRALRDLISSAAAERFFDKFKSRESNKPKVLIGMPCFNEASYLPTLFQEVEAFQAKHKNDEWEYVFCVVNDGSADQSRVLLEKTSAVLSAHHLSNVGVAGGLLTAFKSADLLGAEFVIQCDSDGQHPILEIPKLVSEAKRSGADLLIGSRYLSMNADQSSTGLRRFGAKLIILTLRVFFGKSAVTDPTSGFRVYSKKAQSYLLKTMPDEYPEPESIALLVSRGLKVAETPVVMSARQTGVSSLGGLSGARFMIKVLSALLGLRLRTLL